MTLCRAVAAIFCVILVIDGSDSQCQVGGYSYKVGEDWSEFGQCVGHTCLEDGNYNTSTCEPLPAEIPEGWSLKPADPYDFFPSCCPAYVPGCQVDGKIVPFGKQHDLPGHCNANICKGNDQWAVAACGLIGMPIGWVMTPLNTSKPFPECCNKAVPPLDIVPDVLDKLRWSDYIEISYGGVNVSLGNELTPTQVKDQPQVTFSGNPSDWYLLALVDPDAPSRQNPKYREFEHWMVGNIPGNNITAGETVAEYVGAGPPKDSGLHRYVFLLYKQPGKLTFDEPRLKNNSTEHRRMFSIRKFAQKYNLNDPVAIDVFQAQWDDYVPVLHEQLGVK